MISKSHNKTHPNRVPEINSKHYSFQVAHFSYGATDNYIIYKVLKKISFYFSTQQQPIGESHYILLCAFTCFNLTQDGHIH